MSRDDLTALATGLLLGLVLGAALVLPAYAAEERYAFVLTTTAAKSEMDGFTFAECIRMQFRALELAAQIVGAQFISAECRRAL